LNGAGTPISCNTCHNGLGTGTLNHYNRANARTGFDALRVAPGDVVFTATYDAKTGAAAFDNTSLLRCSNTRCHGGQATPNWQTGTLSVNTQCTSCHASGTAQYNSYNSGQHNRSEHVSQGCTSCHDTAKLAPGHFTNLAGTGFEQLPSATLLSGLQYNGSTCNPSNGGISGCHGQENW
jgi:predicted CxxxxCH...CXXCH cytochrome family protein